MMDKVPIKQRTQTGVKGIVSYQKKNSTSTKRTTQVTRMDEKTVTG